MTTPKNVDKIEHMENSISSHSVENHATKVLFIDDDEVVCLMVTRLMKKTGVILHVAMSLREGLDLIAREKFDCVVVDFQLGQGTALDFILETEHSTFATIVLTAHVNEDLAIETFRHGAQDYLRKDELSQQLLLRSIRYACERRRTVQQIENLNTKIEIANAQLRDIAQQDPLTGVLNRRGLKNQLSVETQRTHRTGGDMAALFIDCDDFKSINDIHGYTVGDCVLQAIAKVLKKTVRPTDHVARIGGDEFFVLLCDIRNAEAIVVAEKIEDEIRTQQISSLAGIVELSCSIGCCPIARDETSLDVIIRRAEMALKQSKMFGKDIASESRMKGMTWNIETELELVAYLNRIENGTNLHIVVQPIVNLKNSSIVGYELCAHGPPGEHKQPEAFLQLALMANRGAAIDMACLRAARDMAQKIPKIDSGCIHINLFPTTPKEVGIAPILEIFREIKEISGMQVCVELSERRFLGSPADFQYLAECLASEGLLFALDGVRLSRYGLEILLFLDPAFLKVDRNLMIGAHRDPGRIRTLQKLVALAARRSIQSVAVGIDGKEEWEIAKNLGFDLGQGYYIDKNKNFCV
jgi:diguanylate cyclase (GGDEF)-like protein